MIYKFLLKFSQESGLNFNLQKCSFIPGKGTPIYKVHKKNFLFDKIFQSIFARLASWEFKLLFMSGRLVCDKMEKIFNKFFWGSSSESKRIHWRSWIACTGPGNLLIGIDCVIPSGWVNLFCNAVLGKGIVSFCKIIGRAIADSIVNIPLDLNMGDIMIFNKSKDSDFCPKYVWNAIRFRSTKLLVFDKIWSHNIPTIYSIFNWRLLNGFIPMD
ncbi:hypothetical protein M5K25_000488 [Dendrobium thyrsiflorum]|uniref:Uncharacterized protein n=1 Tax=Dendrobium thyrsiflorum TaxID=117978 RepID=A0ABD0WBF0_DENTH